MNIENEAKQTKRILDKQSEVDIAEQMKKVMQGIIRQRDKEVVEKIEQNIEVKENETKNIDESVEETEKSEKRIKKTLKTLAYVSVQELKGRLKGMKDSDLIKLAGMSIEKYQLLNSKPTAITANYNLNRNELILKLKKKAGVDNIEKTELSPEESEKRLMGYITANTLNN